MLIEHNNRSTEDKPNIVDQIYNSSCLAKIERDVCYDSQRDASTIKVFLNIRSANLPSVTHTPQIQLQKSTQVNKRIPIHFWHHPYFRHPFSASIFPASSRFPASIFPPSISGIVHISIIHFRHHFRHPYFQHPDFQRHPYFQQHPYFPHHFQHPYFRHPFLASIFTRGRERSLF